MTLQYTEPAVPRDGLKAAPDPRRSDQKEEDHTMANEALLSRDHIVILILSLAQIIGFIVVVFGSGPVEAIIASIAGFAAVLKYLLPSENKAPSVRKLEIAAAICGVGLIVFSIISVMK